MLNKQINYWVLSAFLFYFFLDIGIRYFSNCITNISDILLNSLVGIISGIITVMVMYLTNTQKFLFFNETSSTKDVCSMPSKQTFKCAVYKNGELIGNMN